MASDAHPHPKWTRLHDLALLYLGLMHGADDEIDPAEWELVVERLRAWFPEAEASAIQRALDGALLVYMSGTRRAMLEASAAALRQELGKPKRIGILNDLADIASADGAIVPGEVSFIQQLARYWDLEQDLL